jgi:hypothetical protein
MSNDFWKDYEPEPHKGMSEHLAQATNGRVRIDPVTGDVGIGAPPAQPAPVQEPVGFFDWYDNAHWGNEDFKEGCHRSWNAAIKYTTPPAAKRQWTGLTDEEKRQIFEREDYQGWLDYINAIEAKLKEKNNG